MVKSGGSSLGSVTVVYNTPTLTNFQDVPAQRMIRTHPLLKIDVGEQLPRTLVWFPHRSPRRMLSVERITPRPPMPPTSSTDRYPPPEVWDW
jgi:hypothetical protein